MLAWIMENKEWLFSGIGVVILTSIIGWFFRKRSKGIAAYSVQQTHSGDGDNVGRDKHVKEVNHA